MKILSRISFILLISLLFCFVIKAQSEWLGSYEFDEDGGKTSGGTAIFVTHQIDILEGEDGLIAMIQSKGFQTSGDLIATAKIQGDKLLVYFDSYGENNVIEIYKKGDLLFTMERKTVKGKTEILTFWNNFLPIFPKNEKSGKVYFQKVEGK